MTNVGGGDAESTPLRYYRSADSTSTSSDTEQGSTGVSALAAAGASNYYVFLTVPSEAGTYYYGACVDSVTGESDTTNNCSSVMVTVLESEPDLVLARPGASDRIEMGEFPARGVGAQPGRSAVAVGGNNAAVEEFDGRDDHDIRHVDWHESGAGPSPPSERLQNV